MLKWLDYIVKSKAIEFILNSSLKIVFNLPILL